MRGASLKDFEKRSLCREMVERCDEYEVLKNSPGRAREAAQIRKDILRLYWKIAARK